MWHHVDAKAFLAARGRIVRGPHAWGPPACRRVPWPVCKRCGLMLLRNNTTLRLAKAVCVTEE